MTTGDVFKTHHLPGFMQEIAQAGGLINYIKNK
jgi:3-isopropylmalate/(R)-2-methylmalate dehydratase small subunit